MGGDSNGTVEAPFAVAFPWANYQRLYITAEVRAKGFKTKKGIGRCNDRTGHWGCVLILMPLVPTTDEPEAAPRS